MSDLKEIETEQLSAFDHCVKNNATELLVTDGTPGEIADFVMNSCDAQFHHYEDAILDYLTKLNARTEKQAENRDAYQEKSQKLAMDMWDKIRLKVLAWLEKKKPAPASPAPGVSH